MKIIERIVKALGAPSLPNDLWLDIHGQEPVLKAFLKGRWQAISGGGGSSSSVSYEQQSLTESQKAQARTNIGAASSENAVTARITGTV